MQEIQTSKGFKREVVRVAGRIAQFILVYFGMVLIGILLAAACVTGGILLIAAMPNGVVIMVSLGIIGLGLMVLIFLLKFLFAVSRQDRSGYIRVTEAEQPELYACIRELTAGAGTPLPKHIYFSPEVNASVFYDSGFWSMFLPVRKNLVIGLGLVNSLNVGEFKAVLAHEFGHFSQRSMKLGSFVYQVNRVIHNMLYENSGYARFLSGWARISSYFAFFAGITVKIIEYIQWELKQVYSKVNKTYMGLSREMEFHADAVAASVAGGNNLATALRRIELADSCYSSVLNTCDDWLKRNMVCDNFYPSHRFMILETAAFYELPVSDGLPAVPADHPLYQQFTRVSVKDQWASHPPIDERELALHDLGMDMETDLREAWSLLHNPVAVQQAMTELVYKNAGVDQADKTMGDEKAFAEQYRSDKITYSFPLEYAGCYDGRRLSDLDIDVLLADEQGRQYAGADWASWCNADQANILKRISAAEMDKTLLNAIVNKDVDTSSFDFAGRKYPSGEAQELAEKLDREMEAWQLQLVDFDQRMFLAAYYHDNSGSGEDLARLYRSYLGKRSGADRFYEASVKVTELLGPVLSGETIGLEEAGQMIDTLKKEHEPFFKESFAAFFKENLFDFNAELREKVMLFLGADFLYFDGKEFFNSELDTLLILMRDTYELLGERLFVQYRELLKYQAAILNNQVPVSAGLSVLSPAGIVPPSVENVPLN
ncbi:M48 family metalloprotease [Flavihumibacter stibioxidans]|uniref:Peptidase M48 domain-containing protein n=1 Tax=Flavihumibacter stibioxidans TaxID=1834163 RepID=A0ABR7M8A4_9BACT|nr:M48 family metallopeptidase [Flavihumibacter stibioxidans]MBC6490764.1 hypothetical protein [Flavihumibacter stibioxidans]